MSPLAAVYMRVFRGVHVLGTALANRQGCVCVADPTPVSDGIRSFPVQLTEIGPTLERGQYKMVRANITARASEPCHLYAFVWRDRVSAQQRQWPTRDHCADHASLVSLRVHVDHDRAVRHEGDVLAEGREDVDQRRAHDSIINHHVQSDHGYCAGCMWGGVEWLTRPVLQAAWTSWTAS